MLLSQLMFVWWSIRRADGQTREHGRKVPPSRPTTRIPYGDGVSSWAATRQCEETKNTSFPCPRALRRGGHP